jgi:hypothetical protein
VSKPIDLWIEETPGVSELLDSIYSSAENSIIFDIDNVKPEDAESFRRINAIVLRQFLETR